MEGIASKVGKRGAVVIPARLRRRFGLSEGSFVMTEEREEGVLIRPAAVMPIEVYSLRRRAEFLLNNAVDARDYRRARAEVRRLGFDPDEIPHRKRVKP
jgi:AbrB family looped-hinge helix DNA binding protein